MLKNHHHLWNYITKFVTDNNIKSIFEVGPGQFSPVRSMVSDYTAIDLNNAVDAVHEDFSTMSLAPFNKRNYDLFLAAAVIEHCEGYEAFFRQMRKLPFKYGIVSFFTGLGRDEEIRRRIFFHGLKVWRNKYCLQGVMEFLDTNGYRGDYKIFSASTAAKDTILLIHRTV